MNNKELIQFLKEHLTIELNDDGQFLTIKILIGDEVIAQNEQQIYR